MSIRKRRWGAILLTVCMALSLMTTGAHAAGEDSPADFSDYEVNVEDPYPEGVTVDLFDYWLDMQTSPDNTKSKDDDKQKGNCEILCNDANESSPGSQKKKLQQYIEKIEKPPVVRGRRRT